MFLVSPYRTVCLCALLGFWATTLYAQDDKPAPDAAKKAPPPAAAKPKLPELPKIGDEPKTNDPAAFMPAPLAKAATVDLADSSLREVLVWLREKQDIVVLLDNEALKEIQVLPGDPVVERLDEAPIYLLVNRLRSLGVAWYYEEEILHLTSNEAIESRLTTIPYNIGDLLDAGHDAETLGEVIETTIAPDSWDANGGDGAVSFLGDVLFVRQTDNLHRQIRGLLAALRKHARRTFVFDPPQHAVLRKKLEENVKVAFRDTPLETAVAELADTTEIDIRLDLPALRAARVRERAPVTLLLSDRKLKTVLRAMLIDLKLTWILRDGVLWITSKEEGETSLKTAVYDVRDLCRDGGESDSLHEAIISQTDPSAWDENGGVGAIAFARPGTMVVNNTENALDDVLSLLETYRTALRASKPRVREKDDPNKVITVYYRMHASVAEDLQSLLPKLVRPESWKGPAQPKAPGEMFRTASEPEPVAGRKQSGETLVMQRAVLVIRQTRATHEDIAKVIGRVRAGDPRKSDGTGGGMGGGGFGGGFFTVPSQKETKSRQPARREQDKPRDSR